ncbi:YSC84-related protein [Christiangramia sp. LLG6405-1]|uniref:lipid-binding SYLF domain-containing protein n=1 Tax=Christiangramia sp. LLG6405-1 TaxID=3160832 RepID=UPI0038672BDB
MKNLNVYLKKTGLLMLFVGIVSCGSTKNGDMTDLKADATEAKAAMTAAEPNLAELFASSAGYAIFPNVGKGAYIIGGASGNGIVYENGTMVGYANLKQVDVGLQVGGKAYREVIFFENEEDLNKFQEGDYELSGNATAVILEKGKSKTIKFTDGTAVATMPKAGAMVGVSVAGQRFGYTEM